jgi:hypothetical protein
MRPRVWIQTRYFTRVETRVICQECKHFFEYVKTSKPRKYCEDCAREVHLRRMRNYGQLLRQVERAAREKAA